MRIICWQTILTKYHILFFSKIGKDFAKFVVCCSCDWHFKGYLCTGPAKNKFSEKITVKQESQVALNRSPEFCLKLTNRYLLKAGHAPGESWDGVNYGA